MIRFGLGVAALGLVSTCSRGVIPGNPCSGGRAFEPWDAPRDASAARETRRDVGAAGTLVGFYQAHLRRPSLPDDSCPFEPTCSVFAQDAIAAHGLVGLVLVLDRLLFREHPLAGINYQETCVDGRWRWHDPAP